MNLQDFLESGIAVGRNTGNKYRVSEVDEKLELIRMNDGFSSPKYYMPYRELHPGDMIKIMKEFFCDNHMFKAGEKHKITRVDDTPEIQRIYVLDSEVRITFHQCEPIVGKPKIKEKVELI